MKNLLKLNGAQSLSDKDQKMISGRGNGNTCWEECPSGPLCCGKHTGYKCVCLP